MTSTGTAATGFGRTTGYRYLEHAPEAKTPEYVVGASGKRYPATRLYD